jgi:hypothetical protein
MNANAFLGRFRTITRRRNGSRPAVEPMEGRLALSPTLLLPLPGILTPVVQYHPPNPCISTGAGAYHPPTPIFPRTPI